MASRHIDCFETKRYIEVIKLLPILSLLFLLNLIGCVLVVIYGHTMQRTSLVTCAPTSNWFKQWCFNVIVAKEKKKKNVTVG